MIDDDKPYKWKNIVVICPECGAIAEVKLSSWDWPVCITCNTTMIRKPSDNDSNNN